MNALLFIKHNPCQAFFTPPANCAGDGQRGALLLNLYSPLWVIRSSLGAAKTARVWRKRFFSSLNRVFDRAGAIVAVQFVALRGARGRWHKLCFTS
jgi:hypothetical protein